MTCMTTKQKFDVTDPDVIVLANGRYAYKVKCPWEGKSGKELYAFKFCSAAAHQKYKSKHEEAPEEQIEAPEEEQIEAPEEP